MTENDNFTTNSSPEVNRPVLEPAENMALTIALAQIRRGDEVPPNTTACLIFALARICRGDDA